MKPDWHAGDLRPRVPGDDGTRRGEQSAVIFLNRGCGIGGTAMSPKGLRLLTANGGVVMVNHVPLFWRAGGTGPRQRGGSR